jgi:hypothetical protein
MKKALLTLVALLSLSASAWAAPFTPDAARFTLPEGQVLAHIDMSRMSQSQTFKDLVAFISSNPSGQKDLAEFKEKFGVDPFGLGSITLSVNAPAKSTSPEITAYVTGEFPQEKILAGLKAESKDFDTVKHGEHTLYVAQNDQSTISFVKGGMLAFGSEGTTKGDAVARKLLDGKGATGELATISKGFSADKDVWVAFKPSEAMVADLKMKSPQMGAFTQWVVSVDMAPGLHIHAEGKATAEVAQALATMANMQIQQMKASPQAAMFGGLINKSTISAKGDTLVVDVPLNTQDVAQLKMMAMMAMMSMQQQMAPKQPSFPQLQKPVAPMKKAAKPAAPPAMLAPSAPTPAP